ncbi:MAG TPA: hypothetical protein VHH53_00420 [Pseudonocardiaceae bacterium]|nr:hypothetical protein [Pseudonocardiaceae bacterium]
MTDRGRNRIGKLVTIGMRRDVRLAHRGRSGTGDCRCRAGNAHRASEQSEHEDQ